MKSIHGLKWELHHIHVGIKNEKLRERKYWVQMETHNYLGADGDKEGD